MKIKLLIFPTALFVAIVVVIFYIVPEISVLLDLRGRERTASARFDGVKGITSNIDSLDRDMAQNSSGVTLIDEYIPNKENDSRLLDSVNLFASESAVVLSSAIVKHETRKTPDLNISQEVVLTDDANGTDGQSTDDVSDPSFDALGVPIFVSSDAKSRVQYTEMTVSLFGKYEQIKNFIDKLYHSNIAHKLSSVSIQIPSKDAAVVDSIQEVALSADMLQAQLLIQYPLLKTKSVVPGTFLDAFDNSSIQLSTIQDLQERATSRVEPLQVTPSPRVNPFVR